MDGVARRKLTVTSTGPLVRSTSWNGVVAGDAVVVNSPKELRQKWIFVAHVTHRESGEEWIEVRGGREGEMKGRSFRPELIYPSHAKRGSQLRTPSLAEAPQLPLN
jgi:hypothetical protein